MILTSKNNPLIKETVSLKDKKGRKTLGMFLIEGVKMTTEALKSDLEIDRIFIAESLSGQAFDLCEEKTVLVSDEVMRFLCDEKTPQGVVCRVKTPQNALCKPTGACLLLDGVADPKNMGAIIRTANAAGYREIYLTDDCTDPYSPKSVRASMSGVFFTKLYTGTRGELLSLLADTPVLAADMQGENIFGFDAPESFALVIGNEGKGVSDEVRSAANGFVKIPMQATQESLNAAVSAGILMYLLKKRAFLG
ncbi:MAG: RNA methyltransferase [Clostridia bacterium]|nr:RNA methyltransferase [Clostridia bacterium]